MPTRQYTATARVQRVLTGAFVALFAVAAAACSDDDDDGGNPVAGPGIEMSEFRFEPNTFSVTASRQATIPVTNKGVVVHNLSIPAIQVDVDYRPDESSNLIFVAPAQGPLEFFCKYHRDQGMTGSFTVAT